ncbi:MAG: hypothetical protein WDM89_05180 [Rhizomicrobium sp.]
MGSAALMKSELRSKAPHHQRAQLARFSTVLRELQVFFHFCRLMTRRDLAIAPDRRRQARAAMREFFGGQNLRDAKEHAI